VTVQVYYVPSSFADPYPPDITSYLDSIQTKIGAEVAWEETNDEVYNNFSDIGKPLLFSFWLIRSFGLMDAMFPGDWMRSSLPHLEQVIDSGVRVMIYDGDAVRLGHLCILALFKFSLALRTTSATSWASRRW
jgi:hypothetical protein